SSRSRHTRFSRDWSSDVCSSALPVFTSLTGSLVCAPLFASKLNLASPHIPSLNYFQTLAEPGGPTPTLGAHAMSRPTTMPSRSRSEERRVGKECRSGNRQGHHEL